MQFRYARADLAAIDERRHPGWQLHALEDQRLHAHPIRRAHRDRGPGNYLGPQVPAGTSPDLQHLALGIDCTHVRVVHGVLVMRVDESDVLGCQRDPETLAQRRDLLALTHAGSNPLQLVDHQEPHIEVSLQIVEQLLETRRVGQRAGDALVRERLQQRDPVIGRDHLVDRPLSVVEPCSSVEYRV